VKNLKTCRIPSLGLNQKSISCPSPFKQKSRTEKRVIPIQFSQPLEVTISELDETWYTYPVSRWPTNSKIWRLCDLWLWSCEVMTFCDLRVKNWSKNSNNFLVFKDTQLPASMSLPNYSTNKKLPSSVMVVFLMLEIAALSFWQVSTFFINVEKIPLSWHHPV